MKQILLFLSILINLCTSDQHNYGECRLRTTLDCRDDPNGPLVNNEFGPRLSAGLPGKRGQKGERGFDGLQGNVGETGRNGPKGKMYFHFVLLRNNNPLTTSFAGLNVIISKYSSGFIFGH